jgi:hypothetical protein
MTAWMSSAIAVSTIQRVAEVEAAATAGIPPGEQEVGDPAVEGGQDQVLPWGQLCALIEPFYPRSGNGRPSVGLERMLRLHCLQHRFNLSDPAAEESLYDSLSMRRFVGIDLGREPVPTKPPF